MIYFDNIRAKADVNICVFTRPPDNKSTNDGGYKTGIIEMSINNDSKYGSCWYTEMKINKKFSRIL